MFNLFNKRKKILDAIENKETGEVVSLLKKVKDINEVSPKPDNKDVGNWTFLLHACKYGNSELVELLLKSDADLNVTDSDGKPPLYWAACNNDDDEAATIVKQLTGNGVDFNQQADDGRTPLLGAAISGNIKAIDVLVTGGADPNMQLGGGGNCPSYRRPKSRH